MILQALKEYYDRKAADPDSGIAPEGFERKEIRFLVVLKPNGDFVQIEDTREQKGRRLIGKIFVVPRSRMRSGSKSYETTFLLWDHIGYLFGEPVEDKKSSLQHATWIKVLNSLPDDLKQDTGVSAVLLFYQSNGIEKVKLSPLWSECLKIPSCNMTFKLIDDSEPVTGRPAVWEYQRSITNATSNNDGQTTEAVKGLCMVTGEMGEIARTHGRTPINKDTKSLVAFQKNSGYDSYGKEQCYNAPISKSAEFAYTTGLNTLLKSERQRVQVGDASVVFWSAKKTAFEEDACWFFSEPYKDNPDSDAEEVRSLYNSIWNGAYVLPEDNTHFFVLGLSPNSARISVRFWQIGTVKEMGIRLKQHIDDLLIAHGDKINPALPLRRLLRSIALQQDIDNIPPNLAGETMRSILSGLPYPQTLLQAAVRRIKAERDVGYERAAIIKACLNRSRRFKNSKEEEIQVSLDPNNNNIGYRLGRLFAALEKIQQEASPGINATIRDKFYSAASSAPVTVFGNLMRLKNHHLAKLENQGRRINLERLLGQIMDGITDFPAHLKLEDQGRFAIGYYHQMQDFYTKKSE